MKQEIERLKDAVKHCNSVIKKCAEEGNLECGFQHLDLRDWLSELLDIKEREKALIEKNSRRVRK